MHIVVVDAENTGGSPQAPPQPPPAPRKLFIQKNIEVSTRVRRKLNFDFCANDDEDEPVLKKIKISIPEMFLAGYRVNETPVTAASHMVNHKEVGKVKSHSPANASAMRFTRIIAPSCGMDDHGNDSDFSEILTDDEDESDTDDFDTSIYSTPHKENPSDDNESPVDH